MGMDSTARALPSPVFARYTYLALHISVTEPKDAEWNSKAPQMDVILCPYQQSAAPLLETSHYWGYTSIWNLLDYPAAVFPVSKVDPKLDNEQSSSYTPRSVVDDWCQKHYNALKQKDCPISLQLVGKRMDDEKVIRALEIIKAVAGTPFVDYFSESSQV